MNTLEYGNGCIDFYQTFKLKTILEIFAFLQINHIEIGALVLELRSHRRTHLKHHSFQSGVQNKCIGNYKIESEILFLRNILTIKM